MEEKADVSGNMPGIAPRLAWRGFYGQGLTLAADGCGLEGVVLAEVADGGFGSEGEGKYQAGGKDVATVEGEASDVAGDETAETVSVHAAGSAEDLPGGEVGDEEKGRGAEQACGDKADGGGARGEQDVAEGDGGGVPGPGGQVVHYVEFGAVDVGGEVIIHGGEGGNGQEHFAPVAACSEVEQSATDGGESEPAGVRNDAAQESG